MQSNEPTRNIDGVEYRVIANVNDPMEGTVSHGISTRDEKTAVYAVKPGWHKLGEVATDETARSTDKFCNGPNKIPDPFKLPAGVETSEGWVPVVNQYHILRDGYGVVSDSTVSSRYGLVLDSTIVEMLRPWVDEGFARWDARFLLSHGRESVFSLRLDVPQDLLPQDSGSGYDIYLIVRNPQGGTGHVKGKLTGLRGTCLNTTRRIFATGFDWRVRHVGRADDRVRMIREQWSQAKAAIAKAQSAIRLLEAKTLNVPQTIDALLGIDDDSSTQARNLAATLKVKASDARVGTFGRSALDIYNAVTDYATRPTSGGKSPERSFGVAMQSFESDMFDRLMSLAS